MTELTDQPFDLDGRLDSLFRDAPRLSADRVVAAALTDVSATSQARSLFAIDATSFRVGLLAAMVAALAIGLGLGLGPNLIGTDASPSPGASEGSPVPSDLPSGYVRYRNEADGYEIVVPSTFQALVEPGDGELREGVTRFGSDVQGDFPSGLNVSVGSPDGTVYLCQSAACNPVVVTSTEELEAAIQARWPTFDARRERIVATSLGGEAARLRHPTASPGVRWIGANQACSAYAIHGARPVVLTVPCDGFSGGRPTNLSTLERIVDSFRFISPTTDAASDDWQTFEIPEAGLALDAPSGWELRPIDERSREVDLIGPDASLAIRLSDADGLMWACMSSQLPCEDVTAASIDDLVAIAEAEYHRLGFSGGTDIRREPVDLGDTEAAYVVIGPRPPNLMEAERRYVVAVRDGRSFLFAWNGPESGLFGEIIRSIRFIDAPDPGWQRLSFPEAGFAVEVPIGFSSQDFGDPYWQLIAGAGGALAVRSGDAQNMIHGGSEARSATTVDDLVAIVAEEFQDLRALVSPPEVSAEQINVAGDPAVWITLTPRRGDTSPELTEFGGTAQHVVVIHGDRPFIITWIGETERTFRDLLARFEFLD